MEARHLAYFILACQHRSHAEAASSLGISASALSENLALLEQELRIELFQRGPFGLYPSEAARWLYQSAEPILQSLEAAEDSRREDIRRMGQPTVLQRLEIMSPLRFLMGRFSRAASLAVRALRQTDPDIIGSIRFAPTIGAYRDGEEDAPATEPLPFDRLAIAGKVVIDYVREVDDEKMALLLEDPWVCVTSIDRMTTPNETIDLAALRKGPLFVPLFRAPQIQRVRDYCQQHGLPEPIVFDEDVGTFPKLSRTTDPFYLLAPQSTVTGGLSRLNLGYAFLPHGLHSSLAAKIVVNHPAAQRYVACLKHAIQAPKSDLLYQPRITLKQMRYFLTLCEQLNMTMAARKLDVVQPAISNQLRKLEEITGDKLFRRHKNGLETTLQGDRLKQVLAPAQEILDDIIFKAPLHATAQQQRLTIGIIPVADHTGPLAVSITDALLEWTRLYPTVRIHIQEAPMQVLHRWVEAGKIALALIETPASRASRLDPDPRHAIGVVTSPTAGLLPAGDVSLAQAVKLPLVLPDETFGLRQLLSQAAAEAHISLMPQMEINSLPILLRMVARGSHATILPHHTLQTYINAGEFRFQPIADPVLRRRFSFLFSADRRLTDMEQHLVATIRRHLALGGLASN